MSAGAAEPLLEAFEIAEGPCWRGDELTWVDVFRAAVLCGGVRDGALAITRRFDLRGPVSAALPLERPEDGWLLAADTGFAHLRRDGTLTRLLQPEARERGIVRMNDAKCDPLGRLWAGSMGYDGAPNRGSLFCIDLDGSVRRVLDHTQQVSNGMGWSPDGRTFYFNDSGHGVVWRAEYDLDRGLIGPLEPLVTPRPEDGVPDGLTVDAAGDLWVALWSGSAVHRYAPEGQLLERVGVAAHHTTSCCLGGPGHHTLFITTATFGLSDEQLAAQPDSGRLFATEVDVPGLEAVPFRGTLAPELHDPEDSL